MGADNAGFALQNQATFGAVFLKKWGFCWQSFGFGLPSGTPSPE
jgi:hypothetical protein